MTGAENTPSELQQVYAQILSRAPEHDIDPTLERVREVLDLLGNPHRAYRTVHLTGTNGKTSTARMVEALVGEYGLRTGRFTSPHLTSVTERIAIDGVPISEERFVETYRDVIPYVEMVDERSLAAGGPRLSFFEVLTVMAFAAFADAPIDVAIIEVGLGGRWDSTNVIDGAVAVLTPIARDHTTWLGDTVEQIASEKAGIIKPGATVISAAQVEEAVGPILEAVEHNQAHMLVDGEELVLVGRAVAVGGQVITVRTPGATYSDVFVPLHGEHQGHNALLAIGAVEALLGGGRALSANLVEAAFAAVTSPGRLEVVRSSPTFIVDAAHNPAGAEAMLTGIDEAFTLRNLVAVVAMMADKEVEAFLSVLEPQVSHIVVTNMDSSRAMDSEDLAAIARDVFGEDRVSVADALPDAVDAAAAVAEQYDADQVGLGTGVVVTGSVVLAAQARVLFGREA